jgi:hypothetical protein
MSGTTRVRKIVGVLAAAGAVAAAAGPVGAASSGDLAQGNGTTPDPSAPGTDFAFSFQAIGDTSNAKGSLRLANRSTGTKIRGDVICLQLEGPQRAVIAGRVTSAQGPPPYGPPDLEPGDAFLLFAEDNGKSKTDTDKLSIFLLPDTPPSSELCDADQSGPPPITSGHVTIRDR